MFEEREYKILKINSDIRKETYNAQKYSSLLVLPVVFYINYSKQIGIDPIIMIGTGAAGGYCIKGIIDSIVRIYKLGKELDNEAEKVKIKRRI